MRKLTGFLLAFLLLAPIAQADPLVAQDKLLAYLDQLTQWQRDAAGIEPSDINARELVYRDALRDNATKVLQSGFAFMRSIASQQSATAAVDPESTQAKLTVRLQALDQQMAAMKKQMARLPKNSPQRKAVADELRVDDARHELMQTILSNLSSTGSKSPDKLSYTIESLAHAIPELNPSAKTAEPAPATVKDSEASTSIFDLSADMFEITRKQRELKAMIDKTTDLKTQSTDVMHALRSGLNDGGDAKDKPTTPLLPVEERIKAYKEIGANIIPLAETVRWIDASQQTLGEWNQVLASQSKRLLRQLSVQLGILLAVLAVPLVLSEIAKTQLTRVRDPKRQRQFNTARRIITAVAVVLILLANFISDFSSFATFAGFITAGLAVALQSVLLSLVAHFLFYGRYGVRNGDRVNVVGVTGDIVQIGMVRFYLRELEEKDGQLQPTGKIVAFPNSILFQNVAFYKYA